MPVAKRPHIIVNVAMSADGKIDTYQRKGTTISSQEDKARLDRLRADVDAILVGGRTLVDEDPKLTVKSAGLRAERKRRGLPDNPAKVGVVTLADVKPDGDFMTTGPAVKYIFTARRTDPERVKMLTAAGAKVFVGRNERVDLAAAMEVLYREGIRKVLVEGGGRLLAEFFRLGLVDEVYIYIAPLIFGGASTPTPADGPGFLPEKAPRLRLESVERLDESGGILIHYTLQLKP